ncbi:hypothetical protein D9M68_901480 [compost metagenome]
MVMRISKAHSLEPLITLTSVGDKLFDSTVPLLYDRHDGEALAEARACHDALLREGREHGFFPYRVNLDAMGTISEWQNESKVFHARLKKIIDPDGLIAPGRYE